LSKKLKLIRGLPGSGKTTMAKKIEGFEHFEADQYFEKDGSYEFDPSELNSAHEECQRKTKAALSTGKNVVVSNTFSQQWEIDPYRKIADETGAELEIETATGAFENIHDVPDVVIQNMKKRWDS